VSGIPTSYSVVLESVPSAVDGVWERISSELEADNFSQEDIFAVHLALEEAFINAVKHGNGADPDKKVKIDYLVSSEKVEIFVSDEGDGFDPDVVPDPRCGENLYKPEGRGLLLMRSFMSAVKFNKQGNRVHMVRFKSLDCPTDN